MTDRLWVHCEHGASGPICVFNNVGCVGGHEASPAEVLAAAATLHGAKKVKLPDSVYDIDSAGGEWSDYLVIPLPVKETD